MYLTELAEKKIHPALTHIGSSADSQECFFGGNKSGKNLQDPTVAPGGSAILPGRFTTPAKHQVSGRIPWEPLHPRLAQTFRLCRFATRQTFHCAFGKPRGVFFVPSHVYVPAPVCRATNACFRDITDTNVKPRKNISWKGTAAISRK